MVCKILIAIYLLSVIHIWILYFANEDFFSGKTDTTEEIPCFLCALFFSLPGFSFIVLCASIEDFNITKKCYIKVAPHLLNIAAIGVFILTLVLLYKL